MLPRLSCCSSLAGSRMRWVGPLGGYLVPERDVNTPSLGRELTEALACVLLLVGNVTKERFVVIGERYTGFGGVHHG